ncbi:MAG TPA: hypothetical protein VKU36_06020 [Candidatus Babeliales bacterium]|nr:hypothetical protein [Candidatus Babeliales bacterium]
MKNKKVLGFMMVVSLLTSFFYAYNHYSAPASQIGNIDAIMNYSMPDVIARCQKDHNYTDEDMVILEQELKKYLALSLVTKKGDLGTGMYSTDVDNLWHSFILFTKEYADFCDKYIGFFIHHAPETETVRSPERQEESRKDFQAFVKNYEETFGQEIHSIWFLDMCE